MSGANKKQKMRHIERRGGSRVIELKFDKIFVFYFLTFDFWLRLLYFLVLSVFCIQKDSHAGCEEIKFLLIVCHHVLWCWHTACIVSMHLCLLQIMIYDCIKTCENGPRRFVCLFKLALLCRMLCSLIIRSYLEWPIFMISIGTCGLMLITCLMRYTKSYHILHSSQGQGQGQGQSQSLDHGSLGHSITNTIMTINYRSCWLWKSELATSAPD